MVWRDDRGGVITLFNYIGYSFIHTWSAVITYLLLLLLILSLMILRNGLVIRIKASI